MSFGRQTRSLCSQNADLLVVQRMSNISLGGGAFGYQDPLLSICIFLFKCVRYFQYEIIKGQYYLFRDEGSLLC